MKKTGLLLLLCAAPLASNARVRGHSARGSAAIALNAKAPFERIQTPTSADLYCAGFITKQSLPDANNMAGRTEFAQYEIRQRRPRVRCRPASNTPSSVSCAIRRITRCIPAGKLVAATGQPYAEVGRVRVIDTRSHAAVAQVDSAAIASIRGTSRFLLPRNRPSRSTRRCHFEQNVRPHCSGQGFRHRARYRHEALYQRGFESGRQSGRCLPRCPHLRGNLNDPVDSLSFKASTTEDTQKRVPRSSPADPHEAGKCTSQACQLEIVVLSVTPTTATGMVVYAPEDIHAGDGVEIDEQ